MERSITHFEIYAEEPSQIPEFYGRIFGWRVERMPGVDYWRIFPQANENGLAHGGVTIPPNFRTQRVALCQRCFNRRNGDGAGRFDCSSDCVQ